MCNCNITSKSEKNMFPTHYIWLGAAIVSEVAGSAFLAKSEQFSRLVPTAMVVAFYGFAFYGLGQARKGLPLGGRLSHMGRARHRPDSAARRVRF